MAKNRSVDAHELDAVIAKCKANLDADAMEDFICECSKELAARLLAKVIKRTPKVSGNLQKGWTVGQIQKMGNTYVIEVINPVMYAEYVEYGHRQEPGRYVPAIGKRLKADWVNGQFMMTISAQEIQNITPKLLEARLKKKLGDIFK